ncbi:hypothetical protein AVEN_25139-1 [Araneus ventricosus]|uniref:Uncharacterized protein n=1 Tax=Araneus ventricosus TaxID=182803 RepID=A0A4Y2UAR8_ARAVE|nr:hypothetical protein AVEN_25139-1 [Araneus ventricosus]
MLLESEFGGKQPPGLVLNGRWARRLQLGATVLSASRTTQIRPLLVLQYLKSFRKAKAHFHGRPSERAELGIHLRVGYLKFNPTQPISMK